ncbi:glutathione S-transferase family protein [Limnohabitans sp. Rim11]|uniref:glutathione S-transferase family protein n=1 Tax=Limnohabitans sp. Rim11 TaxID=1100719 RepID=UPI000ABBDD4C|nr:glutathione S-transferase family protein [Limnohabitans sp. Rim11]
MSQLILHHYPTSPFAEKIRLILGYKKLAWQNVIIPMIMPKPDLTALTGGYRRTPVLQIGADIYCDTALIADVLEKLAPTPSLYPSPVNGASRIVAQWADSQVFPAAMAYNFQPSGVADVFAGAPEAVVQAFVADRAAMRGGAPRMPLGEGTSTYKSQLRRLSDMLTEHPYLMGDVPTIADFSAYHPMWFTLERTPSVASILDATPLLKDWMARMKAIGHGHHEKMKSDQAVDVAKNAAPADVSQMPFVDDHGIALGSEVTITADNFGLEPSPGTLVAATKTRLTLRREDDRAGTVHVHFPRNGFILKKVKS